MHSWDVSDNSEIKSVKLSKRRRNTTRNTHTHHLEINHRPKKQLKTQEELENI